MENYKICKNPKFEYEEVIQMETILKQNFFLYFNVFLNE